MNWFKKKDETALVVQEKLVDVSVPDIKEYLVKEYERVHSLMLKIEGLEAELEIAKETQLKYDATLVTLDEYSKRLERADKQIDIEKGKTEIAKAEAKRILNALNSYKIKFNDLALTKEEMREEIIFEFKSALVENINAVKGNLSKMIVAKIINETKLKPTEKGGAE